MGIRIDSRRSTRHNHNVSALKESVARPRLDPPAKKSVPKVASEESKDAQGLGNQEKKTKLRRASYPEETRSQADITALIFSRPERLLSVGNGCVRAIRQ